MKILILGSDANYGISNTFKKAFESLNARVVLLDEEKLYYRVFPIAKNRYFRRLLGLWGATIFQARLIKEIALINPELIFIPKGFFVSPKTITTIQNIKPNIKIFNYNPDNPFNTWAHGNSNRWIINSIPLYDVYFIWGKFLVQELYKFGAKRVEYLPFAFDSSLHYPVVMSGDSAVEYGSDIAFIGTYDKEREYWLSSIADLDLKIWGNSWEKAQKNLQVRCQNKEMVGEDFSRVCNSAKIVLNFIRKQNGDAHNMRTFEVPACGGFLLSTRTKEALEFFPEGIAGAYFSTPQELREKIVYYLNHTKERESIIRNSRGVVLDGNHTYIDRANQILDIFKDLDSNK